MGPLPAEAWQRQLLPCLGGRTAGPEAEDSSSDIPGWFPVSSSGEHIRLWDFPEPL